MSAPPYPFLSVVITTSLGTSSATLSTVQLPTVQVSLPAIEPIKINLGNI